MFLVLTIMGYIGQQHKPSSRVDRSDGITFVGAHKIASQKHGLSGL